MTDIALTFCLLIFVLYAGCLIWAIFGEGSDE